MNQFRPERKCWNFIQDCAKDDENHIEHILRYDADPKLAYQDGRVEKIMENIEHIGMNLKGHEKERWKGIKEKTLEIFLEEKKQENAEAAE